jgi:hypothetical protein
MGVIGATAFAKVIRRRHVAADARAASWAVSKVEARDTRCALRGQLTGDFTGVTSQKRISGLPGIHRAANTSAGRLTQTRLRVVIRSVTHRDGLNRPHREALGAWGIPGDSLTASSSLLRRGRRSVTSAITVINAICLPFAVES